MADTSIEWTDKSVVAFTLRQLLEFAEVEPDALLDAPLDGLSKEVGGLSLSSAMMSPGAFSFFAAIPTHQVPDFEERLLREARRLNER